MARVLLILAMMVYTFLVWALTIGATGYVVFILHHSGWWFLLAILVASLASTISFKVKPTSGASDE